MVHGGDVEDDDDDRPCLIDTTIGSWTPPDMRLCDTEEITPV